MLNLNDGPRAESKPGAAKMYEWKDRYWYLCGRYISMPYESREKAESACRARFPFAPITDGPAGTDPITVRL